ncbi:hypothetical protein [Undibacterium sp.]|jgi:hypothetical protein|uniref:hypothetical protein n=1 Tax=Undibacterium sp. TaxID=1914977 RepID=UPI002C2A2845|nr:hypothetical protein [Undibacterium sp.]HTD04079.1 hypothetical protein [Undibacterium sp.]
MHTYLLIQNGKLRLAAAIAAGKLVYCNAAARFTISASATEPGRSLAQPHFHP